MKLCAPDANTFPVRLEILKAERERRARSSLTSHSFKETLESCTPVPIGTSGSREVGVAPCDVHEYELAEATEAEKATLEEYGFRWLIMG